MCSLMMIGAGHTHKNKAELSALVNNLNKIELAMFDLKNKVMPMIFRKYSIPAAFLAALVFSPVTDAFAGGPEADALYKERTHLLGDWAGARTALAERGIIVDIQATQFYQGVTYGSIGTDDWQYGVKGDLFATLIGEKLGLWKGLIISAHLEARVGDDVNALSGLSPGNVAMLMPDSDNTIALTQLQAIQMFSQQAALAGGKINTLDLVDMAFHSGRGIDGFMNVAMINPMGLGKTVPLALLGAGALWFKGKEVQGAILAYDPNNCATTSCLEQPFQDTGVMGLWKFYTGIGPDGADAGYISIGGTYSGKEYTVISPQSFAFIPGQGLALTETDTSWSIFSIVNQRLWSDPSNSSRALNFRGMYSITDGKANPIKWSVNAALEMDGPIPGRGKDVFGIGYFHTELSSGFKNSVGPLLSAAATVVNQTPTTINIKDTAGLEAYYKAQVTPWLAVSGDVQMITETLSSEDNKVVAGLRAKVTF
jgi:porin